MTIADIYWPYVAYAVGGAAALPFLYFLIKRRWSRIALVAAIPNLVIATMNGAAPIRGLVDPNYVGFGFGLLSADKGLAVTIAAGSLVLASALAAALAIRNRPGPSMLVVAAVSAFHLVNIGFPLLDAVLSDPSQMTIQFGEYLTVPHTVAIPAIIALLILPFLLALPWALQRAFETE
jgi:hypothetical protein